MGHASNKNLPETVELPDISVLASTFKDVKLPLKKRRILAVMIHPVSITLSETNKIKMAGVSEHYWYQCRKDEKFQEICKEAIKKVFSFRLPEVLNAFIRDAIKGNYKNQMAILEHFGILDKPEPGDTNINVQILMEKRAKNLETGLNRFGYTRNHNN